MTRQSLHRALCGAALLLGASFSGLALAQSTEEAPQYYEDNYVPTPFENLPPRYDPRYIYWPRSFNDTRDMVRWRTYVYGWEQDPPNGLVFYFYDDSTHLVSEALLDIKIEIGLLDEAKNFMVQTRRTVEGIPILNGWNRVPVNIHNYKGMIVRAYMTNVRNKTSIHAVD